MTPKRSRPTALLVALALLITGIAGAIYATTAEAAVIRPFATRFTANTTGSITMTGNAILTCPPTASGCLGARNGAGPSLTANNNNSYVMTFIDIDGNPATFNSSRNTLSIAPTATVLWAGLYWGADTTAGASGTASPNANQRNQVMLRTPGAAGYSTLTANQVDTSPVTNGVRYQGFADITSEVAAARSGEYTVANVQAGRGNDRYGGWALVVVTQDPNEPQRNLTVFDGYAVVQQTPAVDQNVAIPVSGFLTPPTGEVRSRIGVVAYEGDLGLLGDSLRLNNTPLTNSLNPATNFFNSSLTGFSSTNTSGDPFQTNMLGFDVDTINANGVLANGATSATINLNTNNDTFFPGVVSFSTELFAPRIDASKSGVDRNGGQLDVGDEVLYTVQLTNNGEDGARNVVLTDLIPDWSSYVPGSLRIDGLPVSDNADGDTGEFVLGPDRINARLGTGASATTGGRMAIGAVNEVSFAVTVGVVPPDEVLTNTARFTYRAATSGLSLAGTSNAVVLTPRSRADLSVSKFGPSAPVTVPGTANFRIVAVNRGPSADPSVVVTDTLPAGFTADAITTDRGSCGASGRTITCDVGALDVGDTATIDIVASVSSGSGTAMNTASVVGANLDLTPNNNTASAVVTLNSPPTAVDQSVTTGAAVPVSVATLNGSGDVDGDPVSMWSVGPAATGLVIVNGDGTITYTPNSDFKGTDTFPFTVTDGQGGFASATVSVTVANGLPVAADDFAATQPLTPIVVDVLANDSDPNGDALSIVAIGPLAPGVGTVTDNGDGTVTFTPAIGFRGPATFTYTISDGDETATATVSITVPDADPVAIDDTADTPSAIPIDLSVLLNDLDPNGDPLSIVSVTQPAGGAATGIVTDNGDGTINFAPAVGFRGDAVFTYTITTDFSPAQSTATVTVTVGNAPPIANDDVAAATTPTASVDIDVLANDSDPNGDLLTIVDLSTPLSGSVWVVGPTITYTPSSGFKGTDTFTYTISDGADTGTATVTVTIPNSPPSGAADHATTSGGTAVVIPVLANDTDPNEDSLALVIGSLGSPESGTVVANADGTITYTPFPGFKGTDSFTYTLTDGTDTATAGVTIAVLDAPPVARDDSSTTTSGTAVSIAVLSNDEDPNGDQLSIVGTSDPANGTIVVNGDGTITYTPTAGFSGDDSFTYTITDGTETVTAIVTVTVTAPPPTPTTGPPATAPQTPVSGATDPDPADGGGDGSPSTSEDPTPNSDNDGGEVAAGPEGPLAFTGRMIEATVLFALILLTLGLMARVFVWGWGPTEVTIRSASQKHDKKS